MASRVPPPSFKTNVHRAKTKRWVEAKTYNYDGGDWGDEEEDEDYEEQEEQPQPPPAAKPTGLRQRGQGSAQASPSQANPGPVELPGPSSSVPRRGSFEAGDEHRTFSNPSSAGPTEPKGNQPLPQQSRDGSAGGSPPPDPRQPQLSPWHGRTASPQALQNAPQQHSPNRQPQPQLSQNRYPPLQTNIPQGRVYPQGRNSPNRVQGSADVASLSAGGNVPPGSEFYRRRDYSPSNMSQPPQSQYAPPGFPGQDTQSPSWRAPPRKESLTSGQRPMLGPRHTSGSSQQDESALDSTQATAQANNDNQSAPRFVRPSDIYRRMEEEREKERRSVDSNRSNVEVPGHPINREKNIPSASQTSMSEGPVELEGSSQMKSTLDPVAERKSEYGLDGMLLAQRTPVVAKSSQLDVGAPSLPQLGRFSSFGADLLNPSGFEDKPSTTVAPEAPPVAKPAAVQAIKETPSHGSSVKSNASAGFRSAVEHAFEETETGSASTPTKGLQSPKSTDGSGVSRSNTDSTAGISPIMSRVPSAATTQKRLQERDGYQLATPPIAEDAQEATTPTARPDSSGTVRALDQSAGAGADNSRVTGVKSGYRRDQNSPPSVEGPARTPAVETNPDLKRSDEAEIAMATPTDGSFDQAPMTLATRVATNVSITDDSPTSNYSVRESDLAKQAQSEPSSATRGRMATEEKEVQASYIQSHPRVATTFSGGENEASPVSGQSPRPSSPGKGRVRDLATKYNEIHDSQRQSVTSPSSSVSSWASSPRRTGSTDAPFSSNSNKLQGSPSGSMERKNSGLEQPSRPRLPGEWVSYATSNVSGVPGGSEDDAHLEQPDSQTLKSPGDATPRINSSGADEDVTLSPATEKIHLVGRTRGEQSNHPMAAVAAAGSALGESLKQTIIGDQDHSKDVGEDTDSSSDMMTPDTRDQVIGGSQSDAQNQQQEYFPRGEGQSHYPNQQSSMRPILPPEMNVDHPGDTSDEEETENDALSKDIVRSLTPSDRPGVHDATAKAEDYSSRPRHTAREENQAALQAPSQQSSYLSGQNDATSGTSDLGFAPDFGPTTIEGPYIRQESSGVQQRSEGMAASKPTLDHRFSWEKEGNRASTGPVELPSSDEKPPPLAELDPSPMHYPDGDSKTKFDSPRTSKDLPMPPNVTTSPNIVDIKSPTGGVATSSAARNVSQGFSGSTVPTLKDILAQKTPKERIESGDRARNHFGTVETGLQDWLTYMVKAHPEHIQSGPASMPRLALNTKTVGGQPGVQSAVSASATPNDSPLRIMSPAQAKGKELYHSAAVFGGRATSKATTGAKGLFAKGKSRFRHVSTEKAPNQSQVPAKRGMLSGLRRKSQSLDPSKPLFGLGRSETAQQQQSLYQEQAFQSQRPEDPERDAYISQTFTSSPAGKIAPGPELYDQVQDAAPTPETNAGPAPEDEFRSRLAYVTPGTIYDEGIKPTPWVGDNKDLSQKSSSDTSENGNFGARGYGLWNEGDQDRGEKEGVQGHSEGIGHSNASYASTTPAISFGSHQHYQKIEPTLTEGNPGSPLEKSFQNQRYLAPQTVDDTDNTDFQFDESKFQSNNASTNYEENTSATNDSSMIDHISSGQRSTRPLEESATSGLVPTPSVAGLANPDLERVQPITSAYDIRVNDLLSSKTSQSVAQQTRNSPRPSPNQELDVVKQPDLVASGSTPTGTTPDVETESPMSSSRPTSRPSSRNRLSKRAPQPRNKATAQTAEPPDGEIAMKRRSSLFDAFFGRQETSNRPANRLTKHGQRSSTGRIQSNPLPMSVEPAPAPVPVPPPPAVDRNEARDESNQPSHFTASGLPTPSFEDYAGYFSQPVNRTPGASGTTTPGTEGLGDTKVPQPAMHNRAEHVGYLQKANIFPTRTRPSNPQDAGTGYQSDQRQTWHSGDERMIQSGGASSANFEQYTAMNAPSTQAAANPLAPKIPPINPERLVQKYYHSQPQEDTSPTSVYEPATNEANEQVGVQRFPSTASSQYSEYIPSGQQSRAPNRTSSYAANWQRQAQYNQNSAAAQRQAPAMRPNQGY